MSQLVLSENRQLVSNVEIARAVDFPSGPTIAAPADVNTNIVTTVTPQSIRVDRRIGDLPFSFVRHFPNHI